MSYLQLNHGPVLLLIYLNLMESHILFIDCFSKFIVVHTVTDHSSEQTIAKFLEIFSEFGVPDELHSDRGTNYTSSLFLAFCKGLDIKLSFSSAHHHSGNPAEHSVQIVKNIMKKCKYTNTNSSSTCVLH